MEPTTRVLLLSAFVHALEKGKSRRDTDRLRKPFPLRRHRRHRRHRHCRRAALSSGSPTRIIITHVAANGSKTSVGGKSCEGYEPSGAFTFSDAKSGIAGVISESRYSTRWRKRSRLYLRSSLSAPLHPPPPPSHRLRTLSIVRCVRGPN